MSENAYCRHSYYLQPNTLPETEGSYHGVYVSNGTCTLDDIGANIESSKANVSKATVKLVVRTMYDKVAELVSTRLCRVQAGPLSFEPAVGGTVPHANSALGDENELYMNIRLSDALRNVASGIVPKRTNPSEVTAHIDEVYDVESSKPKTVAGCEPFRLTGWCLSATGPGESLAVVDKNGVSHVATVVSEEHGQRITARLTEALPPGPGRVVLTTRGYLTQDADLNSMSRVVTILEGETPPEPVGEPAVTNAKSTGFADRTVNIGGGDLTVEGENLATATEVKFLDPDGSEFYTVPVTYADGKLVAADGTVRTEGPASGSVKVTTAGGTATLDVTFTTP